MRTVSSFLQQSRIADYIQKSFRFITQRFTLLLLALLFSLSLLGVISNLTLLIAVGSFLFLAWKKTGDVGTTLFAAFLLTLPLAKGKSWEIVMLAKEYVSLNPLFDVSYFFPVYIHMAVLGGILWFALRNHRVRARMTTHFLTAEEKMFALFVLLSATVAAFSAQPLVALLSVVQLTVLFVVFLLPQFISLPKKEIFIEIISASILFQVGLVTFQFFRGGPLGLYIESFLPNSFFGITAFENQDLVRLSGSFFEPSILATFLLMQSAVIWKMKSPVLSRAYHQLISLTLWAVVPALILTGSRGTYVVGALLIILFVREYFLRLKKIFLSKISLVLLMTIGAVLLPYLLNRVSDIDRLFSPFGSGTYRVQIAYQAVLTAIKKPLGTGLNVSPYEFAVTVLPNTIIFDPAHPHNILFQVLAETGFIGLVIFIYFLFLVFQKIKKPSPIVSPFAWGALVFFLCAQIYPIFLNHPEILTFFFLYLGLALQPRKH